MLQEVVENYTDLKNAFYEFYKENFKNMPQHVDIFANELVRSAVRMNAISEKRLELSAKSERRRYDLCGYDVGHVSASGLYWIARLQTVCQRLRTALRCFCFLFHRLLHLRPAFRSYLPQVRSSSHRRSFHSTHRSLLLLQSQSPSAFREQETNSVCHVHFRTVAPHRIHQSVRLARNSIHDFHSDCEPYFRSEQKTFSVQIASFVFPMVLTHTVRREKILSVVFTSCMLFHIIHGLLTVGLTAVFLLVATLYTLLAVGLIQYVIAVSLVLFKTFNPTHFQYQTHPDLENMHVAMQYVFAVSLVKMFSLMVFGGQE